MSKPTTIKQAGFGRSENSSFQDLYNKIYKDEITVGVVGLGYVGLPLMMAISSKNINSLGFDVIQSRVDSLNDGKSYLKGFDEEKISALVEKKTFAATTDMSRLADADAILICVPTPLTKNREPDLGYVEATAESIAKHIRPGQLVVLESTTYPGTSRDVIQPILEKSGLKSEIDIFIAYSPEREDPGNIHFDTSSTPKVVGGNGDKARELAVLLYSKFVKKVIPVSSSETAEAVKLTENIFRSINIALVNELKVIYDKMGIDVWEVIEAAKTKPFGYMPFYPGPGLGGHCIPIDPFYLTWRSREFGISTKFIELAGEINSSMPAYVIDNLALALDKKYSRGLNGAKILVIGVAYKKNVDDLRESPALDIINLLTKRGAQVEFYDPLIHEINEHGIEGKKSLEWDEINFADFDAALIATDHDIIDWQTIIDKSHLVIDTRNATHHLEAAPNKIIKT
ncbi:MAG: UDP-N-acetyl-D-glucosamine dehydrogenase [Alphaproteobacteria bacterium CG11_big_fil_rev_8_21_14_0_20_44_7]|nr:MAG: UDP-N-acetyl-D-glucosamine dehydrogenase [Alphaproteobacteria bacterium CG11_big_fil_rev_8_21_14_0_20_44_7]